MNSPINPMERLQELLADEAASGLDEAANQEVEQLMSSGAGLGREDFMKVAGLMQVGFLKGDARAAQRMPDELRDKLAQQAQQFFQQRQGSSRPAPVTDIRSARREREPDTERKRDSSGWLNNERLGWYLAAALAAVFLLWRPGPAPVEMPPTLIEQRAALLEAPDAIVLPWASGAAADGYENVSGDVVWSNSRQAGFMRLSGLMANDAEISQYQLWIVDPERDEHPVDGGVFNIADAGTETIIPIDAKLDIRSPAAFAITREQPGGVVVSDGPLLLVAPFAS